MRNRLYKRAVSVYYYKKEKRNRRAHRRTNCRNQSANFTCMASTEIKAATARD